MGSFTNQVNAFTDKTKRKFDLAVRKISLEMFTRVVLKSPVDTGRYRANWQVAIGSIPQGTLEIDDVTGQIAINKIEAATLQVEAGDVITLVNNLPYGPRLENGHSQQAPAGMVALTIQEFETIVKEIGLELVRL